MDLTKKKLLVLGGIRMSCEIVKQAKMQGVLVYVTDYLENSPAKLIADKSFMVSTTDVDSLVKLVDEEKIDGLLTGFIDSMLPYYQKVCEITGIPCYLTNEHIRITTNKEEFKKLCRKFKIPTVEELIFEKNEENLKIEETQFPVLVKPVDNSGARGIFVCNNIAELNENYKKALVFSDQKKIIVEKYMTSEEVHLHYIVQDGQIMLSAMADRYMKFLDKGIVKLPVAYIFPSKYIDLYFETLHSKVVQMFESIKIQNGVILIQSFVENGKFIFYEIGYRLNGSLEYKIVSKLNGINPLEMMINYALTGTMHKEKIIEKINPNYKKWGFLITLLIKPGKIGKIFGIDKLFTLDDIIDIVPAYVEGDVIPEGVVGTLSQVFIRIFASVNKKEEMSKLIDCIQNTIKVYSDLGEDMLLDKFDTSELNY